MSTINNIIKTQRKKIGITQKELADILLISDKTVSRWENGNQIPDALILPDLAKALQITIYDLYGKESEGLPQTENRIIGENTSKESIKVIVGYKIAMIVGLVLAFFGTLILVSSDVSRGTDEGRLFGFITLFSGCGVMLLAEVLYRIFCNNEQKLHYLLDDVIYSGFSVVSTSLIFLFILPFFFGILFNYWYELFAVTMVVVFEVFLIYQKNQVRKAGVSIGKRISVISIFIESIITVMLLAVYILFQYMYINESNYFSTHIDYIITNGILQTEAKVTFYIFLMSGFVLTTMLVINYIELVIKSKKALNTI